MKYLIALLLSLTLSAALADPAPPEIIGSEPAIKAWVEQSIHDSPPSGGQVTMLKHWPPHYAKNDRVGEIWIIPALVQVVVDSKTDYEMGFTEYHVDTKKTDIAVLFSVPVESLPKYLEHDDSDTSPTPAPAPTGQLQAFTMPTHHPLAFTMPTHPPLC